MPPTTAVVAPSSGVERTAKTIARNPRWPGPVVSPGEMLQEEFLKALRLSPTEAAKRLGISANHLDKIMLGKRPITMGTALRLSRLLKTSPRFWMRLQVSWDQRRIGMEDVCA